jgi:3-dehydrosphinganine reductase
MAKTPITHALISGGASGLGNGLACRLLKRGSDVSILDLRISNDYRQALDTAAKLGGSRWSFFEINITDAAVVNNAVNKAITEFGDIQLAINSAGIAVNKILTDTTVDDFQRVIDINLVGSFNFAKAVLPTMKPGARFALLASIAGFVGNYGYSAYSGSKFGVVGLAHTLRNEYEPHGIHVSCICPPEVKTPMVEAEHDSGDPVSLDLKKIAGSLESDDACDQILKGIDQGKWIVVPGYRAKLLAFVARHLPGAFTFFGLVAVKATMKKHNRLP